MCDLEEIAVGNIPYYLFAYCISVTECYVAMGGDGQGLAAMLIVTKSACANRSFCYFPHHIFELSNAKLIVAVKVSVEQSDHEFRQNTIVNGYLSFIVIYAVEESNVVDVIYSKDLIKSVNDNIRKVSIILLIIAALFTYISFALINNTVRLTIFSKRFIINTMKLVGASWNFIRKPFLAQSFTLGIASAILADALLLGGLYWLHNFEPQIDAVIDLKVIVIVSAAVFLFGIIITYLCTLFSLNKYLKMSSNELYYI